MMNIFLIQLKIIEIINNKLYWIPQHSIIIINNYNRFITIIILPNNYNSYILLLMMISMMHFVDFGFSI